MAQIICPKCGHVFDSNNSESFVSRAVAAGAVAFAGARICGGMGIVYAPSAGIAGAIPGACVGALVGWFVADQFRRCPKCEKIFKS